jgi:hypothetical protein
MSDPRGRRHTRGENSSYYDDHDDYDHHEHRPKPQRHRSLGRQALDKLGDALGSLGLDKSREAHHRSHSPTRSSRRHRSPSISSPRRHHSRSRSRDRDHSRDRALERYYPPSSNDRHHNHQRRHHGSSESPDQRSRRPRGRSTNTGTGTGTGSNTHPRASSRSASRWGRGVEAAVKAGAAEAFRLRKEPGKWKGEKGGRVATAALSAGMIGAAAAAGQRHDDTGQKRLGSLGSAVGGLVVNRLVNGPRKEVRT